MIGERRVVESGRQIMVSKNHGFEIASRTAMIVLEMS